MSGDNPGNTCEHTLLCLHAMRSYFAKFGPDDSVSTREIYITISGQRHSRRRQDILLLKSLYKFCNFFFGHLRGTREINYAAARTKATEISRGNCSIHTLLKQTTAAFKQHRLTVLPATTANIR